MTLAEFWMDNTVDTCSKIMIQCRAMMEDGQTRGDVLVFLHTKMDTECACELLGSLSAQLHGQLCWSVMSVDYDQLLEE